MTTEENTTGNGTQLDQYDIKADYAKIGQNTDAIVSVSVHTTI